MDEMKIKSHFLRGIFSKVITKKIKKKYGYDVNIDINDIDVVLTEGKIQLHVDLNGCADQEILSEIMK